MPDVAAPRPLEAKFVLRAAEPGGRAVERTLTLPILPKNGEIGVKKTFSDLDEGATATFDVVAVTADGKRTARQGVHWSLYRISNDYQWYNSDGRWSFERVKSSRRIADGSLDLGTGEPGKIAAQVGLGQHRLDLRSDDPNDAPTSITFDVGWGGDRDGRHARPPRRHARQDQLPAGRGHETAHRLALRRRGDDRDQRRQDRRNAHRRPRSSATTT